MTTTKFKITMEIEVKDVGDVPADTSALRKSSHKATENISWDNVKVDTICVKKIEDTREQEEILRDIAYLEKSASVTQEVAQSIRLKYQDKHKLTGNQFYAILGNFIYETTGRYSL